MVKKIYLTGSTKVIGGKTYRRAGAMIARGDALRDAKAWRGSGQYKSVRMTREIIIPWGWGYVLWVIDKK